MEIVVWQCKNIWLPSVNPDEAVVVLRNQTDCDLRRKDERIL